jgi:hypothetical protein
MLIGRDLPTTIDVTPKCRVHAGLVDWFVHDHYRSLGSFCLSRYGRAGGSKPRSTGCPSDAPHFDIEARECTKHQGNDEHYQITQPI